MQVIHLCHRRHRRRLLLYLQSHCRQKNQYLMALRMHRHHRLFVG
jgi:hypothetical protein